MQPQLPGHRPGGQPAVGDPINSLTLERFRKHPALNTHQTLLSSSEKLAWVSTQTGEDHLVFNAARQGDPGNDYPRYVAGERAAPPEDCGGLPGYYEILAALVDPGHSGHEEIIEDFGDHDPVLVDVEIIEFALRRIVRRRNTAKATFREKG